MEVARSLDPSIHPITVLFQNVLATLPTGCATLKRESIRGNPKDFTVALIPSNESSAEFGATMFGGELYSAHFGRGEIFTTYEAPWELKLPRSARLDQQLSALSKMCRAVIAGRCEHRLERRSTRGQIFVSETEIYRVADMGVGLLFRPRKNVEVTTYAPYYPGAECHTLPSQGQPL